MTGEVIEVDAAELQIYDMVDEGIFVIEISERISRPGEIVALVGAITVETESVPLPSGDVVTYKRKSTGPFETRVYASTDRIRVVRGVLSGVTA